MTTIRGIDVANFFIDIINSDEEGSVTNLQLNKIVFFAQAWSLVLKNKPLFDEDFRAWDYGPVLPSIYHKFKDYGKQYIARVSDNIFEDVFDNETIDFLLDVYREYSKYSATELVNLTHVKGGVWDQIRSKNKKKRNEIIPKDLIKEYYSKQPKLKEWVLPEFSKEDYVGYFNEEGMTVLPADWDEDGEYWDEQAKKCGIL